MAVGRSAGGAPRARRRAVGRFAHDCAGGVGAGGAILGDLHALILRRPVSATAPTPTTNCGGAGGAARQARHRAVRAPRPRRVRRKDALLVRRRARGGATSSEPWHRRPRRRRRRGRRRRRRRPRRRPRHRTTAPRRRPERRPSRGRAPSCCGRLSQRVATRRRRRRAPTSCRHTAASSSSVAAAPRPSCLGRPPVPLLSPHPRARCSRSGRTRLHGEAPAAARRRRGRRRRRRRGARRRRQRGAAAAAGAGGRGGDTAR